MSEFRIVEIETYKTYADMIEFAGTLRNEKKFELLQKVFIKCNGAMYQCKIVGIELPPADNPEYRYKVEIPKQLIEDFEERISLTCQHIFNSIEEAKESALKELDSKYELNKQNIELFFDKYL